MAESNPYGTDLYKVEDPKNPGTLVGMSEAMLPGGYTSTISEKEVWFNNLLRWGVTLSVLAVGVSFLSGCTPDTQTASATPDYATYYASQIAQACGDAWNGVNEYISTNGLPDTSLGGRSASELFKSICPDTLGAAVSDGVWPNTIVLRPGTTSTNWQTAHHIASRLQETMSYSEIHGSSFLQIISNAINAIPH